jgi:hypothetical protein
LLVVAWLLAYCFCWWSKFLQPSWMEPTNSSAWAPQQLAGGSKLIVLYNIMDIFGNIFMVKVQ